MNRILVVEDEPEILLGLQDSLEMEGYEVLTASDGEEAVAQALKRRPDVIILDIMLPKKSGFDVCQELRLHDFENPILMLSARGQEADKVQGLGLGADDYVTKPFSINEVLARVRALIRRAKRKPAGFDRYRFDDVVIDFRKQQATKGKPRKKIPLSNLEFELLRYLIEHRGEPVSREQLLRDVWGYSDFADTRTVDTRVARLRKKIEPEPHDPEHVLTVHGVGYKFVD